jgi:hypothetical protein
MKSTGFFQDRDGNNSLSRLVAFISICTALLYCGVALYLGRLDVMKAAGAIALIFGSMTVPSYTFLFAQKKTEAQTEINSKNNETITNIETNEKINPTTDSNTTI